MFNRYETQWWSTPGSVVTRRRFLVPTLLVLLCGVLAFTGVLSLFLVHGAEAEEVVCKNASGGKLAPQVPQSGMTAVASTQSPLQVGMTVLVTPTDGDIPEGGKPVTLTITDKVLIPAGVCIAMAPEAWRTFDPQDAAYRHADISIVST